LQRVLDDYDIRSAGVDLYNIIGCKSATFGKFTERINKYSQPTFDFPKDTTGDGTVPLISAQSIAATSSQIFFAPKVDHGRMLSTDGIRQQIVSAIIGNQLDTNNKILSHDAVQQNPKLCEIKGENIEIKSPVDIYVKDLDNSDYSAGLAEDGTIENTIPGADYEIWGDHKYVFLPTDEGQNYEIDLKATKAGTFTLQQKTIDGDTIIQTQVFSDIPVSTTTVGSLLASSTNSSIILDIYGNGNNIATSSPTVLNEYQSLDLMSPTTTPVISGEMGQSRFYKSNVRVEFVATDLAQAGAKPSGVLKTFYQLDDLDYQEYSSSTPIIVTDEKSHTLKYYSTDWAGNTEPEQTITFTIDKTPPEFVMQFNPALKDLQFIATDTLPTTLATSTIISKLPSKFHPVPPIKVKDNDNVITATDAAGNTAVLTLKDKDRKRQLKAEIKSLSYNGKLADINKTLFHFDWLFDKKGKLQLLTQQLRSKKDFNILAIYGLNKTVITGRDQSGKIKQTLPGLVLLKVSTNQGDFNWSYKVIN
jgi:hypothetical protein